MSIASHLVGSLLSCWPHGAHRRWSCFSVSTRQESSPTSDQARSSRRWGEVTGGGRRPGKHKRSFHRPKAIYLKTDRQSPHPSPPLRIEDGLCIIESNEFYIPLPTEKSVRLFKVSRPYFKSTAICCQLQTFQLDCDCPPYTALSYTWGSPLDGPTRELYELAEDDRPVLVLEDGLGRSCIQRCGRSLYEALTDFADEDVFIWADAVCIDQENLTEKSSQVQRMGEIFSRADEVVAWLGIPDPERTYMNVFSTVMTLRDPVRHIKMYDDGSSHLSPTSSEEAIVYFNGCLGPTVTSDQLSCLNKLCERLFFTRAWIFQEVAGNQTPVILRLGEDRLRLSDVHSVLSWLLEETSKPIYFLYSQNLKTRLDQNVTKVLRTLNFKTAICNEDVNSAFNLSLLKYKTGCSSESSSVAYYWAWLATILKITQDLEASDPRDLIYSVLYVANQVLSPDHAPPIKPDYSLRALDLYYNVSVGMIQNLSLSYYLGQLPDLSQREVDGLPSWTWDLSARKYCRRPQALEEEAVLSLHLKMRERVGQGTETMTQDVCPLCKRAECYEFFAQGVSQPGPVKILLDSTLTLAGSLCDTVKSVQRWCFRVGESTEVQLVERFLRVRYILDCWCELAAFPGLCVIDALIAVTQDAITDSFTPRRRDSFVSDLTSDLSTLCTIAEWSSACGEFTWSQAILHECLNFLDRLGGTEDLPLRHKVHRRFEVGDSKEDIFKLLRHEKVKDYQLLQYQFTSFFRTSNGLIGVGPECILPGDKIFTINCVEERPVILRRIGDADGNLSGFYRIVGVAYIHGAMQGGYFSRGQASPPQLVTIC